MAKKEQKLGPEARNISLTLDLSPKQQAAFFETLVGELNNYMHYETGGQLTPGLRECMDVLREVAGKMVVSLGYDKTYPPVEFVILGLVKFVSIDDLEKLAAEQAIGPSEKDFNRKVNFYLNQKRREERGNLV